MNEAQQWDRLEVKALKVGARAAMHAALRFGLIEKMPCEVCGATKVDGHHDDYEKPFEVRWLCKRHHLELHGASNVAPIMVGVPRKIRNSIHAYIKTLCRRYVKEHEPAVYQELKRLTVEKYP